MNTTLNLVQYKALIAAGIDPEEFLAGDGTITADQAETARVARTAPKVDGRNLEARAHNHTARMNRRATTLRGGLVKAERRLLAAILRDELGREFTSAEWDANLEAYKNGDFTIEGF